VSFYSETYEEVLAQHPLAEDDPLYEAHQLVIEFVRRSEQTNYFRYYHEPTDISKHEVGQKIGKLKPAAKVDLIRALLQQAEWIKEERQTPEWKARYRELEKRPDVQCGDTIRAGLSFLLRRKLPLKEKDIANLCGYLISLSPWSQISAMNLPKLFVKRFQDYCNADDVEGNTSEQIAELANLLRKAKDEFNYGYLKLARQLEPNQDTTPKCMIEPGEAWSDAALADLETMDDEEKTNWLKLLDCCQTSSEGTAAAWTKRVKEFYGQVDPDSFKRFVLHWFPLVHNPRTKTIMKRFNYGPDPNLLLLDHHNDILKGLVRCCGFHQDPEITRALVPLAISAYKKIPQKGPRAVKIGNACVTALGETPGLEAVGQLAILKTRVKFGTAQKEIEKALKKAAEREGIAREELEEMAVPAYGLTEVGLLREELGEFTAELIVETGKPQIRWIKPDGKPQKSVPAAIKKDFAEDLKELKQSAKDIEKMLPAQAARIEQAYLQLKQWDYPVWRERYLDHPLVGAIARRLIWEFETDGDIVSAIFHHGSFVNQHDVVVDDFSDQTTVKLWHPLDESTEDLVAWRDWLMNHEVRQPFKQAHREIYLLTDAERNTRVYSNRFAAHVLKQHQFNALCGARGWKNSLRLLVDDSYPPAHLLLPSWNLRAEFWVQGAGDQYEVDTNESGTFLYLTTDQVRFYRDDAAMNWAEACGGGYGSGGTDREENHPVNLDNIPALVFSEVMRDVDLFVGVSSVGNDPQWQDGGPEGRYRDYWESYSFGDLSNTAQMRKVFLERLIPRLKITDRCYFSERFLIVRGEKWTYKIHLGSGNILMEPSDEYLCIVPKQSVHKGAEKVFLPFEGDRTLSIILSKAFMLAEDHKIKDPTILSQINR